VALSGTVRDNTGGCKLLSSQGDFAPLSCRHVCGRRIRDMDSYVRQTLQPHMPAIKHISGRYAWHLPQVSDHQHDVLVRRPQLSRYHSQLPPISTTYTPPLARLLDMCMSATPRQASFSYRTKTWKLYPYATLRCMLQADVVSIPHLINTCKGKRPCDQDIGALLPDIWKYDDCCLPRQ
jgi:hypothetical protein